MTSPHQAGAVAAQDTSATQIQNTQVTKDAELAPCSKRALKNTFTVLIAEADL